MIEAKEAGMGQYVDVGGIKTWFDSWGSGDPLVLLHGDLVGNGTWEPMVPGLADSFRVVAPERRGHGHTQDAEGPYTYALMAEDMIAFLESAVEGPAHLVGWSGGANVALMVASRRPDLVRKLVTISGNSDNDTAATPEAVEAFESATAEGPDFAFARTMYEGISPDGPEHWPVVFEKIKRMAMDYEPSMGTDDLGRIAAPTLVVSSDDDVIRLEHTIQLYRSIPNAQLAVVPGTSHLLILEKPEVLGDLVREFLLKEAAPTMMPIRRAQPDR